MKAIILFTIAITLLSCNQRKNCWITKEGYVIMKGDTLAKESLDSLEYLQPELLKNCPLE